MPPLPGGLFPWEPMLEFDTTHNHFIDDLLTVSLDIKNQVKNNNGTVSLPNGPGLGVTPQRDFLDKFRIDS
jgi:D-galactarolactone cycloisomerase